MHKLSEVLSVSIISSSKLSLDSSDWYGSIFKPINLKGFGLIVVYSLKSSVSRPTFEYGIICKRINSKKHLAVASTSARISLPSFYRHCNLIQLI